MKSEEVDRLRTKKKHIYEDLKHSIEREWVGLTEDDIQAILKEWVQTQMTVREMLLEVEAKLKEKNT